MERLFKYITRKNEIDIEDIEYTRNIKYSRDIANLVFMSPNIIKKVQNSRFNIYKYSNIFNAIIIDLEIYEPIDIDNNDNNDNNYITESEFIKNIVLRIYKLCHLSHEPKLKQLDITIFLLDDKKQLPTTNNTTIGIDEVNSGCSIVNGINNKIYIWRLEEVYKVLIHELIHSLDLDPIQDDNQYDILFKSQFSYCFDSLNLFEAYVEFWATILNLLFLMSEHEFDLNLLPVLVEKEIEFSFKQTAHILKFYNIHHFDDLYHFDDFDDLHQASKCKFVDTETSVFMYYFGKLLLLCRCENVFSLCEDYSVDYIINIVKSKEFTDKIIEIMMSALTLTNISDINWYLENHNYNYYNSLRMTYFG